MGRPENVRILRAGRVIPCELTPRGVNEFGIDVWEIGTEVMAGDEIRADSMPGRTALIWPMARGHHGRFRIQRVPWWRRLLGHWQPWMVAFGAILGTALYFSTPSAHADPTRDAAYLIALDAGRVVFPDSATALQAGHEICALLGQGHSRDDVIDRVDHVAALDHWHASYLVGAANEAFCPWLDNSRQRVV